MINLLIRTFIKDYNNTNSNKVRQDYGVFSGVVGIICNVLLCIAKFVAGIMTSSIAITADAVNNLSDAGSSVVSIIGFKMAGKPADKDHPFGHGRIEYIAGFVVSIIIMFVGFELLQNSVQKIINPQNITFSTASVVIMILSILVKFWLSRFNTVCGKKINSGVMLATAKDSLNDCISTAVVVIAIIVNLLTNVNIDGYVGALVAVFILVSGMITVKDMLNPLLGQSAEPELVEAIEKKVLSYEDVIGLHDLIVHNYGVGMTVISLHAEVPADTDFISIHETIDQIERDLKETFKSEAIIHMDPVAVNDSKTQETKKLIKTLIKLIDERITMHDFRIVAGNEHTNLIFDILIPYDFRLTDDEVIASIKKAVKTFDDKYELIIHVDKPF